MLRAVYYAARRTKALGVVVVVLLPAWLALATEEGATEGGSATSSVSQRE